MLALTVTDHTITCAHTCTHAHSNAYAVIHIFLKMSASNTYWPNDMTVMLGTAVYCQVLIVCLSPQEPQAVGGWWTTAFNHEDEDYWIQFQTSRRAGNCTVDFDERLEECCRGADAVPVVGQQRANQYRRGLVFLLSVLLINDINLGMVVEFFVFFYSSHDCYIRVFEKHLVWPNFTLQVSLHSSTA